MKHVKYLITGILLATLHFSNLFAQTLKGGCTDPNATNYNNTSNYSDGSCAYTSTYLTLKNKKKLPDLLDEISGMVYWNGKIYGHQDSGGPNKIYEIDPNTGKITKTITLEGATNIDWEDITQDDTHFYVADIGNNTNGNRKDLKIYKFPKSAIEEGESVRISTSLIETINFSYEDQTDFSAKGPNKTAFDCEAIAYNRGKIHLFTKNWIGNTTTHYTLPTIAGTYIAKKREDINVGKLKITGADFGAYDLLILVGYEITGVGKVAMLLNFGFDGTYYYLNTGNLRRLEIGSAIRFGQVEGVAMDNALKGYISNERFKKFFFSVPQSISSFNIMDYIKAYYERNPLDLNKLDAPSAGTLRYNKYRDRIEGFDGTHWIPLMKK